MTPKIARIGSPPPKKMSESLRNLPKNDTKIWQTLKNRTLPNLKSLKVPAYLNYDEGRNINKMPAYLNCDEGRNINKMPAYLNCDEGRNTNMRSSWYPLGTMNFSCLYFYPRLDLEPLTQFLAGLNSNYF